MDIQKTTAPHSAEWSAVIIRADGRVENVGLLAAGYENPFRQLWWDLIGQRLSNHRIRRINAAHAARS